MKSVHCAAVKFSKSATKLPKSSANPTTFPTRVSGRESCVSRVVDERGNSRASESFHMQQTPLRNKPQVDTRLHSVLGATGKSAEAIFKSYSAGINLAGPDALRALREVRAERGGLESDLAPPCVLALCVFVF